MAVPPPARDRVRLSEADSHLDRHLALYSSEELARFRELQLMPAAREMTMSRLSVGLCVGNGACPTSAAEVGGGGVYLFNRLKEEAEEAVSETLPFLSWLKTAWNHLAILGQIGGLMAFFVIAGSAFKLFCRYLWYTTCGVLRGNRRGGLDGERGGGLEENRRVRYRAADSDEPEIVIE